MNYFICVWNRSPIEIFYDSELVEEEIKYPIGVQVPVRNDSNWTHNERSEVVRPEQMNYFICVWNRSPIEIFYVNGFNSR